MFKNSIVVVLLMMSNAESVSGQDRSGAEGAQRKTNSSADYLGQQPPGVIPELFAPGIVSTGLHEHSAVLITPDGNDIFFTVADAPQHVILHVRRNKMSGGGQNRPVRGG